MPAQEGERPEPPPQPDAGTLLTRRLDELTTLRGSEAAEQIRQEKTTGQPVPEALLLFRRLDEIAHGVAGQDEQTRRDFAILQYACGHAILGELICQDADLSVIVNRQRGRPDTQALLASAAQTEVAAALEDQRRQLAETFPTSSRSRCPPDSKSSSPTSSAGSASANPNRSRLTATASAGRPSSPRKRQKPRWQPPDPTR